MAAVSATERTTAGTDAVLAVAALVAILVLRRSTPASFGRGIWLAAFGSLLLASVLGAVAHGFTLGPGLRTAVWQPLYLALGVTMALFVVGALRDWRGDAAARRALPPMLALALVFYGITWITGGDFLAFVVYEASALLFSLGAYLRLATVHRPGAGVMAAALALSLVAGGIQAAGPLSVRLVWEFDHNGLFHLVQLLGLALLVTGLRRLLSVTPTGRS